MQPDIVLDCLNLLENARLKGKHAPRFMRVVNALNAELAAAQQRMQQPPAAEPSEAA